MDGLTISPELYLKCIEHCPADFWSDKDNGNIYIHCRKLETERCGKMRISDHTVIPANGHNGKHAKKE
ncbi:MAG: hypothetical protein V3T58_01445 [Candidatus Hydrothermarchaeales archaeon]